MTENSNIFSYAKVIYVTNIFKYCGFHELFEFLPNNIKFRNVYKTTTKILYVIPLFSFRIIIDNLIMFYYINFD